MRLIDADKLKDIISDTWILDRIDEQPTVDAVPVVRCRNCKWWNSTDGVCRQNIDFWLPSSFCSWGTKKR